MKWLFFQPHPTDPFLLALSFLSCLTFQLSWSSSHACIVKSFCRWLYKVVPCLYLLVSCNFPLFLNAGSKLTFPFFLCHLRLWVQKWQRGTHSKADFWWSWIILDDFRRPWKNCSPESRVWRSKRPSQHGRKVAGPPTSGEIKANPSPEERAQGHHRRDPEATHQRREGAQV